MTFHGIESMKKEEIVAKSAYVVIYGQARGQHASFDISSEMFLRHGSAIDAVGLSENNKIGGEGGSPTTINGSIYSISGVICEYNKKIYISQLTIRTNNATETFGGINPTVWKPLRTFLITHTDINQPLTQITGYTAENYICGFGAY